MLEITIWISGGCLFTAATVPINKQRMKLGNDTRRVRVEGKPLSRLSRSENEVRILRNRGGLAWDMVSI